MSSSILAWTFQKKEKNAQRYLHGGSLKLGGGVAMVEKGQC